LRYKRKAIKGGLKMRRLRLSKLLIVTLFIICHILISQSKSEAKWWIFGASEDEITIKYIYLNNISYEELGQKVTLFRDNLPDGNAVIKGKATVKTGTIASVRVTLNNKETWQDATLSEDGAFEFRFRPELNKNYVVFIEIMDTRGKTNDIEATRKEITVSERNITAMVKEALEGMAEAYRREDAGKFMSYVAEDFAGDAVNLDRAIRKDFSLFDNIDMRFTINNVASGGKGIVVSINFSRSLVSSRTGKLLSDKGMTEFVFKLGEGGLKVYSMKFPLIFGLSDASNVATGVVQSPSNEPTIVVDDSGNVVKEPFDEAVKTAMEEFTVESGTFTLRFKPYGLGVLQEGFNFDMGKVVTSLGEYDVYLSGHQLAGFNGAKLQQLSFTNINDVKEVPETGYTLNYIQPLSSLLNKVYAIKLGNGKYAVIQVISFQDNSGGFLTDTQASFKYKYQPDGSRRF